MVFRQKNDVRKCQINGWLVANCGRGPFGSSGSFFVESSKILAAAVLLRFLQLSCLVWNSSKSRRTSSELLLTLLLPGPVIVLWLQPLLTSKVSERSEIGNEISL